MIEEGKAREFPNRLLRKTVIGPEVNRAREDAFKPVDEPTVVFSITRQTELFKDFGAGTEADAPALLPDRERRDPNWNEPILPKGQSEIGMSLDLKNEFPVSPRVQKCAFRRSSKRKTAQHERARAKDEVL